MDSPLISVIVPVYNAEHTLKQCVDSILCQSFKDFELILVDDGSKDSSPTLCDKYAEKDYRVHVIHQNNAGVSTARNRGLDIAKGSWVTFVDSDDFIEKEYFDSIDSNQADILIRGYKKKDGTQLLTGFHIGEDNKETLASFLKKNLSNSIIRSPWGKFYRNNFLGDIRFMKDMKIGEDSQFVFHYLARCNSFKLLGGSEYIFNIDNRPDYIKYAISVDYAANSITHLIDAYRDLDKNHHLGKTPLIPYLAYFKRISKGEWSKKPSLWYRHKEITNHYQYVWEDLAWKQRVKYLFIRWLSW